MNYQSDFCILGGGIAGLSLADALNEYNFSTTVIDANTIGSGASGVPGGLVNPATGRRAKKSWKAEQCYEAIASNLEKVQNNETEPFYINNGLLRPALLEKMARKMKEQYESTTWPDGWCQWKSKAEIQEIHPGVNCVDGGLWLPIGLTVNIGKYMQAYARYLEKQGNHILTGQQPQKVHEDTTWHIELSETTVRAKYVVFATGHRVTEPEYWDWLPINLIKGQIAAFKPNNAPLSFSHSISSLGYIANLNQDDTFVQGSTYEHNFEHLNPDDDGKAYLRKRMRRTLPQLEERSVVVDQWAGVRTSTPDYKPILGEHPTNKNMHIFAALGSKGLLYGKFLAEHYAKHFANGQSLYPEIAIDRFDS